MSGTRMQIQYYDATQRKSFLRDASDDEVIAFSRGAEPDGQAEISTPEPSTEQLRIALRAAGMTDKQIAALFAAATSL